MYKLNLIHSTLVRIKPLMRTEVNQMTTLSKFFNEQIGQRKCQDILHPETCGEHFKKDILLFILSNLKYFAPICLLPALINIKSLNKKKLRKTLKYYLGCSVMGASIGLSINLLMCLIRKIYGRFHYYSIFFIPSFFGVFPLYLGPAQVVNLFETTIFQCLIETFFLMRKNIISRTIANSKILQTCVFMTCSAIILHVKRMYNGQGFWLLNPNPMIHLTDNVEQCSKCHLHQQTSCNQYVIKGMSKYFILGISLDLIKMVISPVASAKIQSKLVGKLKNFRIRSMALLTAYIGVYRFAHCWFNRKGIYSDIWNHIISSFLAGCCYYLYPQPTLFSYAVVQAIRSFWKYLELTNIGNQNKTLKLILSIPRAKIMCAFALANLVHLMVMKPKYVSPLTVTVVNGIANKYPTHIQNKVNLLKAQFKFKRSNLKDTIFP